jgi:HEAT repeat protein
MDIHQIEAALDRADFQYRLEAVKALKDYAANIAVPLLTSKLNDPEFLVRSFVCMGLGKQQTAESFAALLEIIKFDNTPNVRAEAANSLSLFGKCAASHLVTTFVRDDHWLVRRSILAALIDLDCQNEVLEVCLEALKSDDLAVREAAIDALGTLTNQEPKAAALAQLLELADSPIDRIRRQVAYALKKFNVPESKAALSKLRQDSSHQVVAAALEDLL